MQRQERNSKTSFLEHGTLYIQQILLRDTAQMSNIPITIMKLLGYFAITHHSDYFNIFQISKREKVGEISFLPKSSTFVHSQYLSSGDHVCAPATAAMLPPRSCLAVDARGSSSVADAEEERHPPHQHGLPLQHHEAERVASFHSVAVSRVGGLMRTSSAALGSARCSSQEMLALNVGVLKGG